MGWIEAALGSVASLMPVPMGPAARGRVAADQRGIPSNHASARSIGRLGGYLMHGAWILLFVILWLVVIVLVILVTGLIRRLSALEAPEPEEPQRRRSGPKVGFPAPIAYGHERLCDIDGSLYGRIVAFLSSTSGGSEVFTRELQRALDDGAGPLGVDRRVRPVAGRWTPGLGRLLQMVSLVRMA